MVDFGGLPYIDVRVSFNSFVPAELDEKISDRLVNYYLDRLAAEPAKHDKVEFDIVFSCYTLDLPERIQILSRYGFSEAEIRRIVEVLRNVTNSITDAENGLWRRDYQKIRILENRYQSLMESDLDDIEKIYWLIEDCKRYGTLPFAGLARAAFIAVQLLGSMVKKGIISDMDYQNFMNDVDTVSSDMKYDFDTLSKDAFLQKYGHLRPGTYDITSLRYDEAPELYFEWNRTGENGREADRTKRFSLSIDQMHRLKDALDESGLNNDILGLMDFIRTVIRAREYGKFIFTRNLSRAIQMIGKLGSQYGLSREDCAHVDVQTVRGLYHSTKDIGEALQKSMKDGEKAYELAKTLVLPPLLVTADEVWHFCCLDSEPNFITMGKIRGEICVLDDVDVTDIADRVVLIASADPGYDWIFSRRIGGFITMYGGANSHMAIRAGELGIPAVIGVGEKQYGVFKRAKAVEIDAANRTIRVL